MIKSPFTITEHVPVAKDTWRMVLRGDAGAFTQPGQFAELSLPGFFLRRPFSVCDKTPDGFSIIYRVVGAGTSAMSELAPGARIEALTGLGNGYRTADSGPAPLLVGGGCGCPPLLWLARRLRQEGKSVTCVLGFNRKDEIFLTDDLQNVGARVVVTTVDGSVGTRGFVTDAMPSLSFSSFYACGPMPMLRAVCAATAAPGQISLEARMGCGFGACVGCTVVTKNGPRRVCKDGPVFDSSDILWQ